MESYAQTTQSRKITIKDSVEVAIQKIRASNEIFVEHAAQKEMIASLTTINDLYVEQLQNKNDQLLSLEEVAKIQNDQIKLLTSDNKRQKWYVRALVVIAASTVVISVAK